MKELFNANASEKLSDDVTSDYDDEEKFKREVHDNEVKSKGLLNVLIQISHSIYECRTVM